MVHRICGIILSKTLWPLERSWRSSFHTRISFKINILYHICMISNVICWWQFMQTSSFIHIINIIYQNKKSFIPLFFSEHVWSISGPVPLDGVLPTFLSQSKSSFSSSCVNPHTLSSSKPQKLCVLAANGNRELMLWNCFMRWYGYVG